MFDDDETGCKNMCDINSNKYKHKKLNSKEKKLQTKKKWAAVENIEQTVKWASNNVSKVQNLQTPK